MPSPSPSPVVVRYADVPPVPWANGGGVTRQLASHPPGSSVADFGWRVSVAEVGQSGAFSPLPGVDRVILWCDGPAMTLRIDGVEHPLERYAPFGFSGDGDTWGTVPDGPTRDLNVMSRRADWSATVEVRALPAGQPVPVAAGPDADVQVIVVLTGTVRIDTAGGPVGLTTYDSVVLEPPGRLRISGAGSVALIRLRLRR